MSSIYTNDFLEFLSRVNKEMRDFQSGFVRRNTSETELPDEIDLYNFFEKWNGHAMMYDSFGSVCGCHSVVYYLQHREDSERVDYFIGHNRYFAINFKARGVFLVSEVRYLELNANKGR